MASIVLLDQARGGVLEQWERFPSLPPPHELLCYCFPSKGGTLPLIPRFVVCGPLTAVSLGAQPLEERTLQGTDW